MNAPRSIGLIRLDETPLTVADGAEDIRGRRVVDRNGDEVGEVKALFVDEEESKVRLVEVDSGGFLGLGGERRLVPVEMIERVEDDRVCIDQTREHVHAAPRYEPELVEEESYYHGVYGYYGYAPYWTAGHVFPRLPFGR